MKKEKEKAKYFFKIAFKLFFFSFSIAVYGFFKTQNQPLYALIPLVICAGMYGWELH